MATGMDADAVGRGSGTRDQILEAADRIVQDRGLHGATTRAIAEAAKCAEGSIYRYFPDKHALFIEVVKRRFPAYLEMMASLPDVAGRGSVRAHLEAIAKASLAFYREILPMAAGAMADRALLEQQRRHFVATNTGPMRILGSVATYLRREQRLGRVAPRVPAEPVARMLLGACFFEAYLEFFLGQEVAVESDDEFVRDTVRMLMEGLRPAGRKERKEAPA